MTLYAAIYLLLPILTNGAKLYSQKLATAHFWLHLVGGIGMGSFMGMAKLQAPSNNDVLTSIINNFICPPPLTYRLH